MDRIEEERIVRLSDGKKLFFDWLKMNGIWAKRKMVEIVKPYYKDLRDVNRFVRSILRRLCTYLNAYCKIDLNLSFSRIIFRVGEKH